MTIEGALIKEQGVTFAIVIVKPYVLQNRSEAQSTIRTLSLHFRAPVVLMAQDARGVPTYYGRPDIVDFLASTPMETIPWSRFTLS
jgi:hypothetical protein